MHWCLPKICRSTLPSERSCIRAEQCRQETLPYYSMNVLTVALLFLSSVASKIFGVEWPFFFCSSVLCHEGFYGQHRSNGGQCVHLQWTALPSVVATVLLIPYVAIITLSFHTHTHTQLDYVEWGVPYLILPCVKLRFQCFNVRGLIVAGHDP